jgi:hypothetical protein
MAAGTPLSIILGGSEAALVPRMESNLSKNIKESSAPFPLFRFASLTFLYFDIIFLIFVWHCVPVFW